ncbi:hypothetical protein [Burkholderia pseudomallei]|uniref:hypothetical protein n=1 Tax=Burkholderia pseudomallei TaxID=28450 RepID=UPI000F1430E3|nr:hypothetical protein [Burkholderia pseudomallei]CAJ4290228.1 Uncharacterised protein [Burkholderia pseudomallei]CAJ6203827.1 Uncharacterised protein [Burkholderia pseudomallei]CAJ7032497.1 Uncharacterised protein [Burkholderia pseudomallei]CAJ7891019.1 Uncharacterised protein [Burkholderia pseudomallei]VBF60522.1 Uncharacterised protein [Burkholderia pseudomallei]
MNQHIPKMTAAFFEAIEPWKSAYAKARLNFIAVKRDDSLVILAARVYLSAVFRNPTKDWFQAGDLVAGQLELTGGVTAFVQAIEQIASPDGFVIPERGKLALRAEDTQNISVGPPDLLHVEGLNQGNRLAVLTMCGARRDMLAQQPQTDWALKAATLPFDSLNELSVEYGLGAAPNIHTMLEIVAHTATEVWLPSSVKQGKADLGLWLAPNLDRSKARLGYRVIDKGLAVNRGSVDGDKLEWCEESGDVVGKLSLEVPLGAVVQCIASYAGHAHNVRWFADPQTYQNARAAILSNVDQTGKLLRGYLLPDLPPKGKAADDFESAVAWMLWGLGFAPVGFGMNAKTRDAFDILAVSPRGDFLVVECTLGLLRAESKLSKLSAREASLRKMLATSGLQHIRVLPIIVTAMTREEIKADLSAAAETGVLVLSREDLEAVFQDERLRFANADQLFDQALQKVAGSQEPQDLPPP